MKPIFIGLSAVGLVAAIVMGVLFAYQETSAELDMEEIDKFVYQTCMEKRDYLVSNHDAPMVFYRYFLHSCTGLTEEFLQSEAFQN